jgi:hypothetical protein
MKQYREFGWRFRAWVCIESAFSFQANFVIHARFLALPVIFEI